MIRDLFSFTNAVRAQAHANCGLFYLIKHLSFIDIERCSFSQINNLHSGHKFSIVTDTLFPYFDLQANHQELI